MNADKGEKMNKAIEGDPYPEQGLTGKILECAFAVHNTLGAGFLEKIYANALGIELQAHNILFKAEVTLKVEYRGSVVGDYLADIIADHRVLVELKACAALDSVHLAQVLNYLRASGIRVGLLLNFGRPKLEYRRLVL